MAPVKRGRSAARGSSAVRPAARSSSVAAVEPVVVAPPPPSRDTYLAAARRGAVATSLVLPEWVAQWFAIASVVVLLDSIYVLGLYYKIGVPEPLASVVS